MQVVLKISFLFIIGGSLGWVLELFYRRMAHGKWIKPGLSCGTLPAVVRDRCGIALFHM